MAYVLNLSRGIYGIRGSCLGCTNTLVPLGVGLVRDWIGYFRKFGWCGDVMAFSAWLLHGNLVVISFDLGRNWRILVPFFQFFLWAPAPAALSCRSRHCIRPHWSQSTGSTFSFCHADVSKYAGHI